MQMPLELILFDLDGTLYPGDSGLLKEIGRRIQLWLCERLGLTWAEADALRRDYFQRYGTTLNGLIAERTVDADDYLTFVHDIPVQTYLSPNPALASMLDALPLRRAVYTNASTQYSWRVLRVLGIKDHFERVISIEDTGLRNKLYGDAYEQALSLMGAQGAESIMVEDSARNLQAAKALGMTTMLLSQDGALGQTGAADQSVDFIIDDVLQVGQLLQNLMMS
jgi:putative hydrolase of the HAD superfamily